MALITARGGSKGLPDKNILELNGKPVIAWTIEAALHSVKTDRVIVSTDSPTIADIAVLYGAEVPFLRPSELAADRTSHNEVILHAVKYMAEQENYRPDFVMLLQPTSPLRTAEDIDNCIALIDSNCDGVISVYEPSAHPALMQRIGADGLLSDFLPDAPKPGTEARRRQNLEKVYCSNGAIFIVATEYLLRTGSLLPEKVKPYIMSQRRSAEIDDKWDFDLVKFILSQESLKTGEE